MIIFIYLVHVEHKQIAREKKKQNKKQKKTFT